MGEPPLELAASYLKHAVDLREVLGITRSAQLQPCPLGQGEHNANFSFVHPETGECLVLRINYASQLGLERQVEYEHAALGELAPSGRTPLPLFVDGSMRIVDRGVLVMQFCVGSHLDFGRPADVSEAARILADIHSVAPSRATRLLDPGDSLRDLHEEDLRLFDAYRKSPLCESRIVRRMESLFACVEGLAAGGAKGEGWHILNTEAVPSHFLIPEQGRPGSMVDWEKPILGEVARDVAYFVAPTTTFWDTEFMFDEKGRAAFVEAYWRSVDGRFARGAFDERFDAYLKMNCLRGVVWSALASTEYAASRCPLHNEKTRRKLRVYLSEGYLDMLARDVFRIA